MRIGRMKLGVDDGAVDLQHDLGAGAVSGRDREAAATAALDRRHDPAAIGAEAALSELTTLVHSQGSAFQALQIYGTHRSARRVEERAAIRGDDPRIPVDTFLVGQLDGIAFRK